MKKRLLSFFLALCMIFSLMPVSAIAEETATTSGTCGENLAWTLEDGTLTISGTGTMTDYSTSSGHTSAPWGDYYETITSVVVEDGVTSIGDYAFYGCTGLASVTMPEGVLSIGDDAFEDCTSLASVTIPKGVTSIGASAFEGCTNLATISLPEGVVSIGDNIFEDCASLTSIIIPEGVTSIGDFAFNGCTGLTDITIAESVTAIGTLAFSECTSLGNLYIPKNVTSIGFSPFMYCTSLKSIDVSEDNTAYSSDNGVLFNKDKSTLCAYPAGKESDTYIIPNGVTTIGDYAFCCCENLKSVIIPDGVKSICLGAFYLCTNLKSITIPVSVTEIQEGVFYESGITDIYYDGTPEQWAFICLVSFEDLFGEDARTVIIHCADKETLYGITWCLENGVLTISGWGAMPHYSSCQQVPWYSDAESITSAEVESGVASIGRYAFYDCNNLNSVDISNGVTIIEDKAFYNCESLESIIIPCGVKSIGDYAFNNCISLETITLPEGVTSIGSSAFYQCTSLTSITIPSSVTDIGSSAFSGCDVLTDVYYAGTAEQWKEVSEYSGLKGATVHCSDKNILPDGSYGDSLTWTFSDGTLTISGTGDMKDYNSSGNQPPWFSNRSSITNIVIEDGVTSIGNSAFIYCSSLESITIPSSVKRIGEGAFGSCSKLTQIELPEGLEVIDEMGFYYCPALTSITIPSSVKSIGQHAFYESGCLTEINVKSGNTSYSSKDGVLFNKDMTTLIACPEGKAGGYCIPDGVTTIEDEVFFGCSGLTGVVIPEGVNSIPSAAFAGCKKLKTVSIPVSVTSVEENAFAYCDALTNVYYDGTSEQWNAITIASGNEKLTNAKKNLKGANTCGENLTWKLANGTLTISGTGAMTDFKSSYYNGESYTDAPWQSYSEAITSVIIESGVTSIGNYAFDGCTGLTSVTISESVTSIGDDAFYGCTSLTSVTMQEGVTSIGNYAFRGCTSLASVNIPESVTSIGNYVFCECTSLTSINIPNGVTSIGDYAFDGCTALKDITIAESVTEIGNGAFSECSSLESVYIPQNVTSIGELPFGSCTSLKSIDVSENNTAYCSENGVLFNKDKSVMHTYPAHKAGDAYIIPNGVKTIDAGAFAFCASLKSLTVPISVTEIQILAFYNTGLTDIYYAGTTEQWASICTSSFEYLFGESTSSVIIHCSDKETPYGITWSIEDGVLTVSGLGAMPYYESYADAMDALWHNEAEKITSVVIENGVTSIGSYAFTNCKNLKSVTIPNSVKAIEHHAFSGCTNLESITVPNGATYIEQAAFFMCTSLKTATIPVSVTYIGEYAFQSCIALTDIYYGGTVEQWQGITSENDDDSLDVATIHCSDGNIFLNGTCGDNLTWKLANGTLTISGTGEMYDYDIGKNKAPWNTYRTSIADVIVENGVTSIGNYAFYDCTDLVNAELPGSITSIGDYAFSGCDSLESVTIPNTIKSIGFNAFHGISTLADVYYSGTIEQWEEFCTNIENEPFKHTVIHCSDGDIQPLAYCGDNATWTLENGTLTISGTGYMENYDDSEYLPPWIDEASTITSIIIESGITGIGSYVFSGLQNLEEITIPDGVEYISVNALAGCIALEEIDIPSSVNSIGQYAFGSCESIKEITIPDGITSINEGLLYGCVSLAAVTIPASVTSISADTFADCSALTDIYYGGSKEQWKAVTVGDNNDCLSNAHVHYAVYPNGTCGENLTWKLIDDTLTISGTGSMDDYSDAFSRPWHNQSNSIQKVVVEEGVSSIGEWAFSYLRNLTDVSIGDTVADIGDNAFYACYALETIDLPDSVENIGADAFSLCNHMTAINVGENNAKHSSHNGVLFDKNVTELIIFPEAKSDNYDIPDSVTKIDKNAFFNCLGIGRISIPAGITTIDEGLFADCDRLDYVYIPDSITKIGANAFPSGLDAIFYGGTREQWDSIEIDGDNTAITNAEIRCEVFPKANTCGERVMWVYENGTLTISGTGEIDDCIEWQPWSSKAALIKNVVIKNGVTAIGGYAFRGFENLEEVTIPDSVTRIDENAFEGCSSLKDVYFNGTREQWNAIIIDSSNNEYLESAAKHFREDNFCGDSLTWTLEDGTLTISGTGEMYSYDGSEDMAPWMEDASTITNVVISDGVTSIGNFALYGCLKLEKVVLPDSVTSIGDSAFSECHALNQVNYGGTIEQWNTVAIGDDNDQLKRLTIHCSDGDVNKCGDKLMWKLVDGVLTISGDGDMYNYASGEGTPWHDLSAQITSVIIESGATSIGDWAFDGCWNLESVQLPEGITSIGDGAFLDCGSLQSVSIPKSVNSIGKSAFQSCTSLRSIEIPAAVQSIGDGAFGDCTMLTDINVEAENEYYCSVDGVLFDRDKSTLLMYPAANERDSYSVPDGTREITYKAFANCTNLKTLNVSYTVTSIADDAFAWAYSLKAISVDEDNANYCSDDGVLFDNNMTVLLLYPISHEGDSYEIPSTVYRVMANAFNGCRFLRSIAWPSQIETICIDSLYGCKNLETMYIPASVKEFLAYDSVDSGYTFGGIIYYEGTSEQWDEILQTEFFADATVYYEHSTEHEFSEWTVEKTVTCTENGVETRSCLHCDTVETREIPATGHSYTDIVTEPTCTERGYTTHTCECGDSYSDSYTDALGHDYGEWTQTKAPTCTEKGEETRHCSRCDSSETNEIAPTGHTLVHHEGKAATCTEKGWEAYDTCESCDCTTYKEIPATGHNYTDAVTEPTCTEKGYTTHTCAVCGYSCKDSYTDALGHSYEDGKCTRCGATDPSTVEIHAGRITASSEKGRAGEEVTVSISISDNPGISAIKLGIDYDKSKLQLVGFEDAGLEGWYVAENAVWLNGCDSTFNGVMLKLKFKILENCEDGDTEVTVSYTTGDICNYNEERVCPDIKGGKVTVHSAIPGDITGDGVVNTLDLLRLQKYLSGEDVQIVGNADINGDGVVDALDLLVLKKYLAGEDIQIH